MGTRSRVQLRRPARRARRRTTRPREASWRCRQFASAPQSTTRGSSRWLGPEEARKRTRTGLEGAIGELGHAVEDSWNESTFVVQLLTGDSTS